MIRQIIKLCHAGAEGAIIENKIIQVWHGMAWHGMNDG